MTAAGGTGNPVSRLRHRLTLQQELQTPDGAGGYTRSWEDVAELWGEIIPLVGSGSSARGAGKKIVFGDQIEAEISHRILIRYRPDIVPAMRLTYETRLFKILMIANIDERNNVMQLLVQEGVAT